MKKKIIILFIAFSYLNLISAQTKDNYSDELLSSSFKTFQSADFELADYMLPFLKKRFIAEIKDSVSFYNPYDSLSKYITIKQSSDKLLKIYCWNERNSGCRWSSSIFAQFKTKSGKIRIANLEEIGVDYDEDLFITGLHYLELNNESYYLVIGVGGHCGNTKYSIARAYKILNDTIVKCDSIFENKSELESGTSRTGKIEMTYSSESNIFSYNKYIFNEENGFYSDEKSIVKWLFTKNGFKKIN